MPRFIEIQLELSVSLHRQTDIQTKSIISYDEVVGITTVIDFTTYLQAITLFLLQVVRTQTWKIQQITVPSADVVGYHVRNTILTQSLA